MLIKLSFLVGYSKLVVQKKLAFSWIFFSFIIKNPIEKDKLSKPFKTQGCLICKYKLNILIYCHIWFLSPQVLGEQTTTDKPEEGNVEESVEKIVPQDLGEQTTAEKPEEGDDEESLIKKVEDCENSLKFKEAVQTLDLLIKFKPEDIDLILKRCLLRFKLGRFSK